MDEPEEIDDDVQDHFITRWTATPPCTLYSVTFAHELVVKHKPMRNYQLHGLNWLIQLYDNGINGILADEMVCGSEMNNLLQNRDWERRFRRSHFYVILRRFEEIPIPTSL